MNTITALITPFNSDLSVDYDTLIKLITFQNESNVDGLLMLGTTSESFSLTLKEKLNICKLCFDNYNKIKIIGIEGNNKNKIINEIDIYKSFNPDYYLITPPYFNKGNKNGIINYYNSIANYANAPIFIYNIPSRSGINLDIDIINRLSYHQNIAGIKNANTDINYINKLSLLNNDDFIVMTGNDENFLINYALNKNGVFSILTNIIPNYISKIFEMFEKDNDCSIKMYKELIPLTYYIQKETNPLQIKKIMTYKNLIKNYLRDPFLNDEINDFSLKNERIFQYEHFTNW